MNYSLFYIVVFIIISYLLNANAAGIINGKYTENIKDYHLAVPHKATPEGEFSSFHLSHFHDYDAKQFMKRRKRQLDDPDSVHYGIFVDNQLHHVELWPNRDFLHPQAIFERRDPTLPVKDRDVRSVNGKKMCYYIGQIRGNNNSRVALSTCDGLTGYIHFGKKMYFVEPVDGHSPNEKGHHLHVVYPANTESPKSFCGVKESPENWENSIKSRLREEYLNGRNVFKRQSFDVVPQWMELMLVADKRMIMKHKGKRDIEEWMLTIISAVKSFYSDGSMTGVLDPVVVRIIMLEKEEEEIDLNIQESCEKTLENFCLWAVKLQPEDETHPNHFDVAILLSDWDFCDSDGDCGVQGLAFDGMACSKDHNCQLNEDRGMITTIVVSHEQGHLLGMPHDGVPPSICPPNDTTDNSWYVMSPIIYPYTVRWSPCSTACMRQLAENHLLDCFNDEPSTNMYPLSDRLPGVIYGVDEQCNMFKDANTTLGSCNTKSINCSTMFCQTPAGCEGWLGDGWADGTPCGENKWCFKTKCEPKGSRPSAIDGGWGDWGEWSACSKNCSRGIQYRERICDNPKPENRGRYCTGRAKEYRICNPQDCPLDAPSLRETLCKEMFPTSNFVKSGKYKAEDLEGPMFDPDNPCSLTCVAGKKGVVVAKGIKDGAKCEIGNPLKMCVGDRCIEVGCDGKFGNSEAVVDKCGICNGDGTMCTLIQDSDTTSFKGYRMIVIVPSGAKKVKIEETEPNSNILALGLPDNKTVKFNHDFKIQKQGVHHLGARSFFLYTKKPAGKPPENMESMIWDWTREDIGIYIGHVGKKNNKTVKWSWIEPSDSPTREPKYRWEIVEYKECSAKCNGGIQEAIVSCYEEVAGKVAPNFCDKLEKPTEEPRKCNEQPCIPEWKVGPWGPCRACKEKGGVRLRQVQCEKPSPKIGEDDIITEDSECKEPKPGTVELCETRKKCGSRKRKSPYVPAKFQASVWQQMNKLHLVKRGLPHPRTYLKGKAPTTIKCTTAFNWTPPIFKPTGKQISIDREFAADRPAPIKLELIKESVNDTENEHPLAGPNEPTIVIEGTTQVVKGTRFPHKKHNATKGEAENHKTTIKPKNQTLSGELM